MEELNSITRGIKSDEIILISSNPRKGKTSLLINLAVDFWLQGNKIAIFSNDLSASEIDEKINRLVYCTNQEILNSIEDHLLRIDDFQQTPEPIKDVEFFINELQFDFIFIDNIERLKGNVFNNLISLSKLSKKYQVPIICSCKSKNIINEENISLEFFPKLLDIQEYIGQVWWVSDKSINILKNRKGDIGVLPVYLESFDTGMFIYRNWNTNEEIDQEVNRRIQEEGGYDDYY